MSRIFLLCDIFGYKPSFLINNSSSFKTTFGALISLLIVGLIITSTWFFGKDVIFRQEPSVIFTTYNDPNPLRINLTDKNFIFAVGVTYPNNTMFIDDKIFTLDVQRVTMLRDGNGNFITTTEDLATIQCSQKNITIVPEYFKNMDLSTLLCIKDTNTYVKGDYGQEEYSYLHFGFNKCQNTTENNNHCSSASDMSLHLNGGYISMFMSDSYVVPTNFSYPFATYGKNMYDSMSDNIYKEFNIYLSTVQVKSDQGWLLQDISLDTGFQIATTQQMWDMRDTSDMFYSLNFRCSLNRQVISRKYVKVQTVGANVGGVMRFLLIFGELIVYYFRQLNFNEYLANIFYDSTERDSEKKNESEIKLGLKSDFGYLNTVGNKQHPTISVNQSRLTKKEVKLSFWEKLFPYCYKSNSLSKKLTVIDRVQEKLNSSFDWIHFLKIQNEISQSLLSITDKQSNMSVPAVNDVKKVDFSKAIRSVYITKLNEDASNNRLQSKNKDLIRLKSK